MRTALKLHSSLRLLPISQDKIQIRLNSDQITLPTLGKLVQALARHCDGSHSQETVATLLLNDGFDADDIEGLLEFFHEREYFASATGTSHDALAAKIEWIGSKSRQESDRYDNRLGTFDPAEITVYLPVPGLLSQITATELRALGFQTAESGAPPDEENSILLICSDSDDHRFALQQNEYALGKNIPALFAALTDSCARIGPFVLPKETSCFACYHHRLRSNITFHEEFDNLVGVAGHAASSDTAQVSRIYALAAASHICAELLKFVHKTTHIALLGRVMEIDLVTYQSSISNILKLPRCTQCGMARAHVAPTRAARDLL